MNKKAQREYFDREIVRINQELRLLKKLIELLAQDTPKEKIIKKFRYVI